MKHSKLYLLVTMAVFSVSLSQAQTAKKTVKKTPSKTNATTNPILLKNSSDSLSYALGMDIARSLKSSGFEVDLHTLSKGLEAVYQGQQPLLVEEEVATIIQNSFQAAMEKRNAELKKPGEDFLTALKSNPDVKSTPEGVLYEVLVQGEGSQPQPTDEVKVHYAGYLIDGEKFDSSYDRGEPINLRLNQVIEGWKVAVPLMKIGSKYKLYIPYHLAYGERETGSIPAFSTLIFEIELLDIIKPDAV